ncbi:MAG: glucose-6-phosphate dehydrogenase assembly protein OpcA [Myxococcota bacterium]
MTPDVERFTGGHAVGVDVAAIERDLAALWRKASTSGAEHSVTRACSWNLVVYATTDAELARAKHLADALVAVVPSRTLLLNQRTNANGPEVEAFVTANCRMMPGGGKLVCTEEITLEARGRGGDHLPSLTRALLVPDIPTAVLWASVPARTPLVDELVSAADRLIVDTGALGSEGLERVQSLGTKATHRVADLAWLRTAPRRLAIAGAFDPPVDAGLLYRLKRVSLECAPEAVAGAKLLLGWLGARLGWGTPEPLDHRDTPGWRIPRQQGTVLVDLTSAATGAGLACLTFESERGERVRVTSTAAGLTIDGTWPTHTLPHVTLADEALVVAALGPRGRDKLYPAALHRATELEDRT